MARLVVKSSFASPSTAGVAAHLANYIGYIATREGVELNGEDPSGRPYQQISRRTDLPPTEKQERVIHQLLEDFPDSKGSLEYEDYLEKPSMASASEFITRCTEDNFFEVSSREGYIQYLATRPGAERQGAHGLWGATDEPLELDEAAYEVAHHNGNVWTHIISLRREDAANTGLESAEAWRELVRSQSGTIAQAMGIPPADLRWYAAFHNESHHPHIHMVAYSVGADPYLGKKGLQKIKSGLANEIFREELTEIYQEQTQRRDDLTSQWRNMLAGGEDLTHTGEQLTALAKYLSHHKGRAVYGYLPGQQRELVNRIVDELGKHPRIQSLYDEWYAQRDKITGIYKGTPEERLPLSQNSAFKPLKNAVITTAAEMATGALLPDPTPVRDGTDVDTVGVDSKRPGPLALPELPDLPELPEEDPLPSSPEEWLERHPYPGQREAPDRAAQTFSVPPEEPDFPKDPLPSTPEEWLERHSYPGQREASEGAAQIFSDPPETLDLPADLEDVQENTEITGPYPPPAAVEEKRKSWWTEAYKNARLLLYGSPDQDPDPGAAFKAMSAEAATGNPLAQHDLGRLLLQGIGTEADPEAAAGQFQKALAGFEQEASGKRPAYWQYRIGKMYAMGYGVDQDYSQAAAWYQKSVDLGNPFAAYALAGLYYRGNGVPLNYEAAFHLYEVAANDERSPSPYAMWELAKMCEKGIGTDVDPEAASGWYTTAYEGFKALENRQIDDKLAYRLGRMEYEGLGTEQDIPAAIKHFERAVKLGNPSAAYYLAKIHLQGEAVPRDVPKAIELLEGLKESDFYAPLAAYNLGKFYLEEPEILDIEKGIAELEFAAQKENPYAAYKLARILSQGELVPKDIPRAVDLLEGLKQDDTFAAQAAYQLAKIHLEEPEALDIKKGIAELEFAAQKENPYAAYKLARILSQGELVAKDAPRAVALLESLKRDENFACQAAYQLGMLRTSDLTVWDMAKGIEDLQFAYAQGSHFAGCALGRIYLYGQGEYHDQELGLEYLRDAAAQGNEYAAQTLEQVKAQEIKQETFAVLGLLRLFERSIKPSHQQQQKPSSDRYQRHKELEKKQAQGMNL